MDTSLESSSCVWVRHEMAVSGQNAIEQELAILKRRWGSNLEVLGVQYEGDEASAACFKLAMPPTDPDFPVCLAFCVEKRAFPCGAGDD